LNIGGTEINLAFKAFEIYVTGCMAPHCEGCHNSELWDFAVGDLFETKIDALKEKAADLKESGLADYAWILGGEPLDQNLSDLARLISEMKSVGLKIVLWTHYRKVPESILSLVDYVKSGEYVKDGEAWTEPVFGVKLANREQRIYSAEDFRKEQR